MIILGVILLLVGYLLLPKLTGVPLNVETICVWGGWILLIVGIIVFLLGQFGNRRIEQQHFSGTDGDGIVKLFENACGAVDVSGLYGGT